MRAFHTARCRMSRNLRCREFTEKLSWKSNSGEPDQRPGETVLKEKPEAVYVEGDVFLTYPVVHQLRKKHIPVLTRVERDGEHYIVRIPSGS